MAESYNDSILIVESLTDTQVKQLCDLMNEQWWAGKRQLKDVQMMLKHTNLVIAAVEHGTNRLVGFGRVLTDFTFRATVYDVMVVGDQIGKGLGRRLLSTIINHPKLKPVEMINLCCEERLFPFYVKWGFEVCNGRAEWMVKVQHADSIS